MGISGLPRDTENKYRALPQFGSLGPLPDNVPPARADHKIRGGAVKLSGTGGGKAVEQGERKERQPRAEPPPDIGPGTELKKIFKSLGVSSCGCDGCAATLAAMNRAGVDGCREQRDKFIAEIKSRKVGVSFAKKVGAAALAVLQGMTFLASADPIAAAFDEAIRRAEETACGP